MCSGLKGKSYHEKLKEVGLTTLEERRIRGDLIQVYKTMHGIDDVRIDTWFQRVNPNPVNRVPTRFTSDCWNLIEPSFDSVIRRNFWSVRSVERWNNLPIELKSSNSVNTFKINYDKFMTESHRF